MDKLSLSIIKQNSKMWIIKFIFQATFLKSGEFLMVVVKFSIDSIYLPQRKLHMASAALQHK